MTAAPLAAASLANPELAHAAVPKKFTNTPFSGAAFWSTRMPTAWFFLSARRMLRAESVLEISQLPESSAAVLDQRIDQGIVERPYDDVHRLCHHARARRRSIPNSRGAPSRRGRRGRSAWRSRSARRPRNGSTRATFSRRIEGKRAKVTSRRAMERKTPSMIGRWILVRAAPWPGCIPRSGAVAGWRDRAGARTRAPGGVPIGSGASSSDFSAASAARTPPSCAMPSAVASHQIVASRATRTSGRGAPATAPFGSIPGTPA